MMGNLYLTVFYTVNFFVRKDDEYVEKRKKHLQEKRRTMGGKNILQRNKKIQIRIWQKLHPS